MRGLIRKTKTGLAAFLFGCSAVSGFANADATTAIYACEDSSGRRITSDRPIPTCMDREQRVLGTSGVERARIGPRMSEKERLEAENRQRLLRAQEHQAQEAKRREQALMQRYPRQEMHEAARKAALDQVDELIDAANLRMDNLRIERGKQAQEMAFYRKDPTLAPTSLQRQIENTEKAMDQHLRYLQARQSERRELVQRFDAELVILEPVWKREAELMEEASKSLR